MKYLMKGLLSVVIALTSMFLTITLIIMSFTSIHAASLDLKKYGNFKCQDAMYGSVSIRYYTGKKTSISIPEKLGGRKVTGISLLKASNVKKIKLSKYIKNVCLSRNRSLKKVTIDKENKYISVKNNIVLNKKKTKLLSVLGGYEDITVPKTVKILENGSFFKSKVKKVTIYKNVKRIKPNTFSECKKLKKIIIKGNSIPKIEEAVMCGSRKNIRFYVDNADLGKKLLKELKNKADLNAKVYVGNKLILEKKINLVIE